MKDASDILQAGKPGDIKTVIYAATGWRPAGIVNAAQCVDDVRAPRDKVQSYRYPSFMPKLQEMTGGMRLGEVTYHVAGTGVGKSTGVREIIFDLVHAQHVKTGLMSFEDTRRDAQMLIMSLYANERLQMVPLPDPEDKAGLAAYDAKMVPLHAAVFGGEGLELFDATTAEWSMEAVLSYIRYMARALGCLVVIVDPLSFIAALLGAAVDERRALDMVAAEFAQIAKELNIALSVVHHLKRTSGIPHEEGAPTSLNELRSSGGMANFATCVVGWERNNQADGEAWRVTQSRVLKPHRMIGKSGLADVLYYGENGRLVPSPLEFPKPGKPGSGGEHGGGRGQAFPPSGDY